MMMMIIKLITFPNGKELGATQFTQTIRPTNKVQPRKMSKTLCN